MKNIEIIDLGLYLKQYKTLILTDFHMGFEETLNKQGILVPRFQLDKTLKRLERIFLKVQPETIVINGDLKHEFSTISETEWLNTLKLVDYLLKNCKTLILNRGNHDTILEPIIKKRNLKINDYTKIKEVYITHGDRIPNNNDFKESKIIIIGNEHPAVALKEEGRRETYKCFLKGKFQEKVLIVQPSFNLVTEGTDILREDVLSPFLHQDLSYFEIYVIGKDKVYNFGKIRNIN